MTAFALRDIQPNPFRHMDRYPVRRDKVDALRESLRVTGFWDNVVARACDGGAEIAYGHHRLVALREEFGDAHEIDLIIRDLDDTTMLQIMARENSEEWGADSSIDQETVRAVVEAYAAGRIELPAVPDTTPSNRIRYAPHFGPGVVDAHLQHPYTAHTIGAFLGRGWQTSNCNKAHQTLQALALVDAGEVDEAAYTDLGPAQARAVTTEASRAKKRAESQGATPDEAKQKASEVATAVSDGIKSGKVGAKHVRQVTDEHVPPTPQKQPPQMDDFARKLASDLNGVLNRDRMAEQMDAVLPYAADLGTIARRELDACLTQIAERADGYRTKLRNSTPADAGVIEITSGGHNA